MGDTGILLSRRCRPASSRKHPRACTEDVRIAAPAVSAAGASTRPPTMMGGGATAVTGTATAAMVDAAARDQSQLTGTPSSVLSGDGVGVTGRRSGPRSRAACVRTLAIPGRAFSAFYLADDVNPGYATRVFTVEKLAQRAENAASG
jgi:hypothetical protein